MSPRISQDIVIAIAQLQYTIPHSRITYDVQLKRGTYQKLEIPCLHDGGGGAAPINTLYSYKVNGSSLAVLLLRQTVDVV